MFKLFSIGHFSLIILVVIYTIVLSTILKKQSFKNQKLILTILAFIGVGLFAFRWRILLSKWFNDYEITPGQYGGFLPLELCNIGVFVLPFTVMFRKRSLLVFSLFVNLLGVALAFLILPEAIQIINFWQIKFWDFFILHANLVAIPFAMIKCGWYQPRLKDAVLATMLFMGLFGAMYFINLFLELIKYPGDHWNYLFVRGPKGFPIISQLWSIIPIPFIYILPLLPIFFGYCFLVTLPFVKKSEFKAQWHDIASDFKIKKTNNQNQ